MKLTASEALQYLRSGRRVKAETTDDFYQMYRNDVIYELRQVTHCAADVLRQFTPDQFESVGFGMTFEPYDDTRY